MQSQEFCMKKEKETCPVCTALFDTKCQVFGAKQQDTGARIALDTGFCQSHYVLLWFPSVWSLVNSALE